jgi:hypothetical protein
MREKIFRWTVKMLGGIKYVLYSIDGHGHWEKLFVYLSTYWWTLLVFLISSSFLSLLCLVLIRQAAKPVLWIIIFLCPAILLALSVSSLVRYSRLRTVSEGNNFTSMSSYWFGGVISAINFISTTFIICYITKINLSMQINMEANNSLKPVLLFPIVQSIVQVFLVSWFLTIASYLSSLGSIEYRVVDACSSETCINTSTEKMCMLNDLCHPAMFAGCTVAPSLNLGNDCFASPVCSVLSQHGGGWNTGQAFGRGCARGYDLRRGVD